MTPANVIERIEFLLSFGLIVWFFYGPWQRLILDITRQRLFEMRDQIFLLAADQRLDFQSVEYKEMRRRFNSLIRYCHDLTWSHVVALIFSGENFDDEGKSDVRQTIGRIADKNTRKELSDTWRRAAETVMVMVWLRAPFLMIITMIVLPILILSQFLRHGSFRHTRLILRKAIQRDIDVGTSH